MFRFALHQDQNSLGDTCGILKAKLIILCPILYAASSFSGRNFKIKFSYLKKYFSPGRNLPSTIGAENTSVNLNISFLNNGFFNFQNLFKLILILQDLILYRVSYF